MIVFMDDFTDWRAVAERLETMPRGSRNKLARALGMDASYLKRKLDAGGNLTVLQAKAIDAFMAGDEVEPLAPPPPETTSRRVPVYGYAAASGGDRLTLNTGEILDWIELPMGLSPRGDVFVVRALGSSMEPRIFDGESLVIQRAVPPTRDRDALIEFNDGSGVVKTYKGQRDGKVFAHQYNDDRQLQYDATSVKQLHTVFCRL